VTEIANSARVTAAGSQEQVTNFPVKVRVLGVHNTELAAAAPSEGMRAEEVPQARGVVPNFRPGMSGTVDIFTQTVTGAVTIPIQAVTVRDFKKVKPADADADAGPGEARAAGQGATLATADTSGAREDPRKVVFIVEDGKARMVEVQTGISDETHIEVKSGLAGGEQVVIGPYRVVSRELEPGQAVKVEDPNRNAPPGFATR